MLKLNKKVSLVVMIVFMAGVVSMVSCKKDDEDPDASSRQQVLDDYNNVYLGSALFSPGWTGNAASCDAGTASQASHDMVIKRINYFRKLVGLNSNTTLDASKFPMYQEAALMMKANSALSHTPPNTWKCWTQTGYDGAITSNLSLGNHSVNAITSFMTDNGANNKAAGHRRWILHSEKTQFSYGTTDASMSLGTIGTAGGNTQIPEFIAYPAQGFMPVPLIFPRWSFGIPGADFSNATVSMKGPKGTVVLAVVSKTDVGYGDNTIVWEPQGIVLNSASDVTYTVTINGIGGTAKSTYTYEVTLIQI
jgi:hypothetical protein